MEKIIIIKDSNNGQGKGISVNTGDDNKSCKAFKWCPIIVGIIYLAVSVSVCCCLAFVKAWYVENYVNLIILMFVWIVLTMVFVWLMHHCFNIRQLEIEQSFLRLSKYDDFCIRFTEEYCQQKIESISPSLQNQQPGHGVAENGIDSTTNAVNASQITVTASTVVDVNKQ